MTGMTGITGVAFTMYPVTDVKRARKFYRETLGLRQQGMDEAWWVEFDVGAGTFGIGNVPDNGKPGSAQSLVLEVKDLSAYRKRLREHGVASSEPQRTPYNCLVSQLKDPDGNTIWLHEKLDAGR